MAKRKKYTLEDLPEPGTVFVVPLADGRVGACRVLRREMQDVPRALIAASEWTAHEPPPLGHPAVQKILGLNNPPIPWGEHRIMRWVETPPPEEFREIGRINVSAKDEATVSTCYGDWDGLAMQILSQWRWDNEREKVLAENEVNKANDLAKRAEAGQKRREYLSTLTFSKLLAKDFLPAWDDYPPEAAKEGCRKIIYSFIQTMAETKAPLKRDLVVAALKKCVEELNQLDSANDNFICTMEREDLCEVLEEVLHAAKFPELTDEIDNWRDW